MNEEAILILLAQHGDMAAFETLLRRIHNPLRSYVSGMVGSALSEDVLQEISLQIYRKLQWLREPKVFRAWVYRIATRTALVHLKRERRWRTLDRDADLDAIPAVPCQQNEVASDFLALADQVSPASRAVLLLHYQQHLSLEETAAILDIPLGTAKSRLSYGVATLRKYLSEKGRS